MGAVGKNDNAEETAKQPQDQAVTIEKEKGKDLIMTPEMAKLYDANDKDIDKALKAFAQKEISGLKKVILRLPNGDMEYWDVTPGKVHFEIVKKPTARDPRYGIKIMVDGSITTRNYAKRRNEARLQNNIPIQEGYQTMENTGKSKDKIFYI